MTQEFKNYVVCNRCEFRSAEKCSRDLMCQCTINRKTVIDNARSGECPKGKYSSEHLSVPNPMLNPPVVEKVIHGAAGLAKAAMRVDRADHATIERRKAICAECPHKGSIVRGVVTTCRLCGCALAAKQRIASEKCPAGKW